MLWWYHGLVVWVIYIFFMLVQIGSRLLYFFTFMSNSFFFNWFFYIFKNYFFSAFNIRLLRVGLCYFFRCGHYRLMTWIMDMRCKPKLTLVFFLKRILYVFFFLIFAFDFEFLKYWVFVFYMLSVRMSNFTTWVTNLSC